MAERSSQAGFFCTPYVGLRCILLLVVLEGHYWFEAYPIPALNPLSFAVPCFFALSGFLISHTLFRYEHLPKLEALKTFYIRRALRILPVFYLVLVVGHLVGGTPYFWWQMSYLINVKIYTLSAYQPSEFYAYLMTDEDFRAMHFWSVNVEEQYYLLYPLLILFTSVRSRTQILCSCIGLSIFSRFYFLKYHPTAFYGGLGQVAGEFILWACLFAWYDYRDRGTWYRSRWVLYGSMACFAILAIFDGSYGTYGQWRPPAHQTVYAVILGLFIVSLRHNTGTLVGRALSVKALAVVGRVSYGAYLLHLSMNPLVDKLVGVAPFLAPFPQCPRAVAGPIVTVCAALLVWYGFEEPINRWRKRWSLRTTQAPGSVGSSIALDPQREES
jgi:peptidoglycan/LPS O-acetylase OafA/YrhL